MDMCIEPLSADEETIVVKLAKQGNINARNRLIGSIYDLINRVAIETAVQCGCINSIGDLVNEGFMGACRAFREFDPSLGFRFGTYAIGERGWVRVYMQQAVAQSHLIHASKHLRKKYGYTPSFVGFDSPLRDGSDRVLSDIIADDSGSDEIEVEIDKKMYNIGEIDIYELIAELPDGIEKEIIAKSASGMTCRQIADEHYELTGQKMSRMTSNRMTERAIANIKKNIKRKNNRHLNGVAV